MRARMSLIRQTFFISALSFASGTAIAVPFTFEARSLGMGGANVATADIATAAWANPAMLTEQRPDDSFSLLVGFGAYLRDNDDLVGDVKDFQSAQDRRVAAEQAGDTAAKNQALIDQSELLRSIDGKLMAPEITGAVAMGAAFDDWAMAISARGDLIAAGAVTDLACDLVADPTCDFDKFESEIDSDNLNILEIEGVLATEIGVSFATALDVANRKFSIGIKPKIVDLKGVTFSESIRTLEAGFDNINDGTRDEDIGTFTTIDLGLAYEFTDNVRLGLNVRNLITDEFKIQNNTLNYDTEARLGVAYRNNFMTLALDYDLVENEPLLANNLYDGLTTQYLNLGAEFNAFDFAQLRIGAAKNTASGISDDSKDTAYTAGIGLWLGFNLDLAMTLVNNTAGGFVQTGFRF